MAKKLTDKRFIAFLLSIIDLNDMGMECDGCDYGHYSEALGRDIPENEKARKCVQCVERLARRTAEEQL